MIENKIMKLEQYLERIEKSEVDDIPMILEQAVEDADISNQEYTILENKYDEIYYSKK